MPSSATRTDRQLRAWQGQLSQKLSALCDRDDWPAEKYARLRASQILDQLRSYVPEADQELIDLWADVATGAGNLSINNTELWLDCPRELTGFLEEAREAQGPQPPRREAAGTKPVRALSETRDDAKSRLEHEVHDLRQQWSQAVVQKNQKHADYKAAQKYEEELLEQYLRKVGELDEINHGGTWQRQLPWNTGQS